MANSLRIFGMLVLSTCVTCIIQEAIIIGQGGSSLSITAPEPDLETASAALGTWTGVCFQGWWEGYTEPNFGGNPIGFYISETQFCYQNISPTFQNLTKSLKPLGLSNTDESVITFYSGPYYTGENLTLREDQVTDFTFPLVSFVTQGFSEWTLFQFPAFQGNYTCINVNSTSKVTTHGDFADLPEVGSLTRGCADYDPIADLYLEELAPDHLDGLAFFK